MSLLDQTMRSSPLLGHRRIRWARRRTRTDSVNPTTGAPVTTTSSGTVWGWFSWARPDTRQDFSGDGVAFILTTPGQLQAGDTIRNPQFGSFVVLDDGVKPQGEFDRVELRRAGT